MKIRSISSSISDTIEEDVYCQFPPNSGQPDPGYLDCDFDNDGTDDLIPLSGGNRSWLDLDGGGGGASDLSGWIKSGFPGNILPHTWIAGNTGAKTSVYETVHETQLHRTVIIPVFNDLCPEGLPNVKCPGQMHTEDTIVMESENQIISTLNRFHTIMLNASVPVNIQNRVTMLVKLMIGSLTRV